LNAWQTDGKGFSGKTQMSVFGFQFQKGVQNFQMEISSEKQNKNSNSDQNFWSILAGIRNRKVQPRYSVSCIQYKAFWQHSRFVRIRKLIILKAGLIKSRTGFYKTKLVCIKGALPTYFLPLPEA